MDYLEQLDPTLAKLLDQEATRQQQHITLIPSENYTHPAIREAMGSVCTNKYSEGYPGKRYYHGNQYIDQIEELARERTKQVFNAKYANVQPYSGSPANLAVYFALLEQGDKVMGLELSHGGHLTHGFKLNFSGKWFKQTPIFIEPDGNIDYDKVGETIRRVQPKMIIAGITAYPKELNYAKLSQFAKEVGAYLVADISHTNGLVLAGIHQHPFDQGADVITSTTHKLLRGPRGAVILTNTEEIAKKIDKAIMPGLQGGPHNHQTAAIAVAMLIANTQAYKDYVKQVAANAQALAKALMANGFELVSGGTQNHLMLVDLRNLGMLGVPAADLLEQAGIVVNANTIPNDPNPPLKPSGIRVGTPAATTRGFKEPEMEQIAVWMKRVLIAKENPKTVLTEVKQLTKQFPVLES